MRGCLLFLLAAGALGAETTLHIVAVERKGPPPYEGLDRVYRLDGGSDQGLRVGQRLAVSRAGAARPLGHLWLTAVHGGEAEARFDPRGEAYPLKGDLVQHADLPGLPRLPPLGDAPPPVPAGPETPGEAPPQEGLLFFLPQRADLSPAGQRKLQAWVQAWGPGGRWVVQVPASRALRPSLQQQRAEALQAALKALGVDQAALETGAARSADGPYDPAWIRHWD